MSAELESLARALQRGEGAADLLQREFGERLARFCTRYLGDRGEALDAVQEVFVKLLAAREPPEHLEAWIYAAARNHCLNLRRAPRESALPEDFDLAASLSGEPTRAVRREDRRRLAAAFASLTDEQRETLRLRYLEGLSREDVARVLSVPVSMVKARLFEATKRLRELLSIDDGA